MAATDFLRKILLRFPAGKLRRATENNIFTLIRLTTYYLLLFNRYINRPS